MNTEATKGGYENRSAVKPEKRAVKGVVASLFLLPFVAWAGGVVTNCTEASLVAAMAGGGTVTFACAGTITLGDTLVVTNDTVLDGSGHQVTISGGDAVRLFLVNTNTHFALTNLSVANGYSPCGSVILNLGGVVSLGGVAFSANTAFPDYSGGSSNPFQPGCGGAIFNAGGTVMGANCSFTGNKAATTEQADPFQTLHLAALGGAIYNQGQMALASCTFSGNEARGGDSIVYSMYGLGDPGSGGAIHNEGSLTLDLCTLANNCASGGASFGDPTGLPGAGASGGAICNEGTLIILRSTLRCNSAAGGNGGQGMRVTGSPDPNGYPGGPGGSAGGGAIASGGWLSVSTSTFVSNVVTGAGGGSGGSGLQSAPDMGGNGANGGNGGSAVGAALWASGTASLVDCTVAFNTGSGGAGGFGGSGAMSVTGSSGGNGGDGGAGVGGFAGVCSVTNCTLADNAGNGGPGGPGGWGSTSSGTNGGNGGATGGLSASGANLVNTLLAANAPGGNGSGTFTDLGHNLSSDGTCSFTNVGSMNNTDPKLGPLADNGGPTLTMALLPGSPAIDAGDTSLASATDQRGFPRPAGAAADIGAFEYGSVMPMIAVSRSNAVVLNLLGLGNTGRLCRLLGSLDLSNWVPLATNPIGSDGTVLFQDTCVSGGGCRFYRLVMP